MEATPAIVAHGRSVTGNVREDNQDAIQICDPDAPLTVDHGPLYAIADGMGGYEHGGLASATALRALWETFYGATNSTSSPRKLRQGVERANLGVYQTAQRMGAVRMGTTLTAVNLVGNHLHVAHVGDSRLYLIRDGKATCLTNDHTTVGELVRMRVLSPDKVRNHSQRSILNKCLGINLFVQPDITQVIVQQGDVLVLCTDGVWSVIEDDEFASVAANTGDTDSLSQGLIELAMERESDDNASAIAIHIQRLSAAVATATQRQGLYSFLRNRLTGNL
jgi:PPM family protein phosphatase